MRKMLLSLTVLAGVAALATGAEAAPQVIAAPMLDASAYVQPVQYYGDWRRY